ncbi:MAG TPA: c-type cytochrome [Pirellulaceae bacterium]|jgi:putative heme-binding domain-containing protein|nr:c-type cytochrome [Pirellulaceae bacterium]
MHGMTVRSAALAAALLSLPMTGVAETPHWIWGAEERSAGQRFTFVRPVELAGRPASATLDVACDFATCRLRLNGETLAKLDEYGPWLTLDVTDRLRPGRNLLDAECTAGEGPAALALSLRIELADGTAIEVVTDESWNAKATGEEGQRAGPKEAVILGKAAPELWTSASSARISAFDDYEQWRQASGDAKGPDPATFLTQPGFEVDLVREATPDEGSWVSVAFDPKGRLTIAREDQGLLRMTLTEDSGQVVQVETIDETLKEVRGLLYAHDALYANANNSLGLYRLRDADGDDRFEEVSLLRQFPGGVGHGRNDLALGPDGSIYSIHGDSVDLPTENVIDRTSPLREARRGGRTTEGYLVRTDKDGQRWEILASGLRNPFGVDFNADGEAFTYDADAEHDMGTPWYRPTRIDHLVSGADFGWRGRTGEWPPYFPDGAENALPAVDVGEGSPTALKSGAKGSFPPRYQRAMFALDWAYGRILACHLSPRGAGYACRVEQFLKGKPLNVTDLDFGPDGSLYLVTGGRKTQSALYRVRYVGEAEAEPPTTLQQTAREAFGRKRRELRRRLEAYHRPHADAVAAVWPQLGSPDPALRQAARVALEHQPVDEWRERALAERDPETAATALLALTRSGEASSLGQALSRANELDTSALSTYGKLTLVRAYRSLLTTPAEADEAVVAASHERLTEWLAIASSDGLAPLGAGGDVTQELARLASDRKLSGIVRPLMTQLREAESQRERMHSLFVLRSLLGEGTTDDRRLYFEALRALERTAYAGDGMPAFLRQLRKDAVAGLTEDQKRELGESIEPEPVDAATTLAVDRPLVRRWTLAEAIESVEESPHSGDAARGAEIFREANCAACHRLQGRGGVIGPDLSSAAGRFSRRDLLASIVEPSQVIAERYRGVRVVTTDGRVVSGRLATEGDYRRSILRIVEDPMRPADVTEISKNEVDLFEESPVSTMPTGLLDTFSAEEIADLLSAITASRGD